MVDKVRSFLLVGRGFKVKKRAQLASGRPFEAYDDHDVIPDVIDWKCGESTYSVAANVRIYPNECMLDPRGMVMNKRKKAAHNMELIETNEVVQKRKTEKSRDSGNPTADKEMDMNSDMDEATDPLSPIPSEELQEDEIEKEAEDRNEDTDVLGDEDVDSDEREESGLKLANEAVRPVQSAGRFHHSTKLLLFSNYELLDDEFDNLLNGNDGGGKKDGR